MNVWRNDVGIGTYRVLNARYSSLAAPTCAPASESFSSRRVRCCSKLHNEECRQKYVARERGYSRPFGCGTSLGRGLFKLGTSRSKAAAERGKFHSSLRDNGETYFSSAAARSLTMTSWAILWVCLISSSESALGYTRLGQVGKGPRIHALRFGCPFKFLASSLSDLRRLGRCAQGKKGLFVLPLHARILQYGADCGETMGVTYLFKSRCIAPNCSPSS